MAAKSHSHSLIVRACDEISGALCCRPPGLLARRERRAYRVVCKERTTQPAGLRAAVRRGAAAGGHLLRCRSSTMSPHRLRRGALHLPARRSRQSASLISSQALKAAASRFLAIRLKSFRGIACFPIDCGGARDKRRVNEVFSRKIGSGPD